MEQAEAFVDAKSRPVNLADSQPFAPIDKCQYLTEISPCPRTTDVSCRLGNRVDNLKGPSPSARNTLTVPNSLGEETSYPEVARVCPTIVRDVRDTRRSAENFAKSDDWPLFGNSGCNQS